VAEPVLTMDSFFLRCFGVGDGTASAERNHSAYLYRFGEVSLLVDCGEPISRSFKASGLSYDLIDRILISHLHADHIGGLFMLLQGFWLEKRKKDLHVHLPKEGIQPLRQMLQAAFLFDELLPFRLTFSPWSIGEPVVQNNVRVTPFPTSHLHGMRKTFQSKYPGDYAAFCFLLESEGRRIGHSADIGSPTDLEPLLAKPLDLLVCEVAHFRPEELFSYLKGRDIKRIAFTHVARYNWERLEETRQLAARLMPGANFSFPRDLETIQLP
jgi:ribonuclease BN (tRNA processing enzyme)